MLLFLGNAFGQAAGDGCAGMHLAPADHLDHGVTGLARVDDLAADLQSDLVDHAQDVAFCHGRIRSHDEIGAGQRVEMRGVVGDVESRVEQFTQHLGRARRVDVVDHVGGFGGSHVVRFGAHAADAVGQQWHFLYRAAYTEAFKAAQFGNLEVGVGDIAIIVQEDFDLAVTFETGDGVDGDSLSHIVTYAFSKADLFAFRSEPARLNR